MTDAEYEKIIAHSAGVTVDEFRSQGGRVIRCRCRGPLCREGWDVAFVSERGHAEREPPPHDSVRQKK